MILSTPTLRLQVEPAWGAAIVRFDWIADGEPVPLMRPFDSEAKSPGAPDPNDLACYPLVPWAGRISGNGFRFDGRQIALDGNRAEESSPIHGTGWQHPWQVERSSNDELLLFIDEHSTAFDYRATLHYLLRDSTLDIALTVTNRGAAALPFGLGLHSFFPRHEAVRLRAPAREVWRNNGRDLFPVDCVPVPPEWDFANEAVLDADIDHCFEGWPGLAAIRWPQRHLALDISSDARRYVIYAPADSDFFCFEPIDHSLNAVNLPGGPALHGMTILASGEHLTRHFSFRASRT
ncbi:MAG: aldose 1-epimerase [Rhodanobacter sp.]|nr:MAG: aldose 1-epimerase [Rhodanobacter sp.]